MEKDIPDEVIKLKKEKKYEEIYQKYGSKMYKSIVPSRYAKQDIKRLKKEGKYEDIYNKYGEKEYSNILVEAQYNEIKQEQGKFKAVIWRIFHRLKFVGVSSLLTASILSAEVTAIGAMTTKEQIKNNAIEYEKEIEDYNKRIDEYAKNIKSRKLNDVQTFMKVMDDMWQGIKGYKAPEIDAVGFLELDLATEEGYGVCRNMASDVAKKLNKINPQYNARTMAVNIGEEGEYEVANIERNVVEDNPTVQEEYMDSPMGTTITTVSDNSTDETNKEPDKDAAEESNDQNIEDQENVSQFEEDIIDSISSFTGNHMVTLVDVKEDNVTLVLDPTNPGIGIYKNGKITMFNTPKENGLAFVPREYFEAVLFRGGFEGLSSTIEDFANSFRQSKLTDEEIEEKYGLESQNRALEESKKYLGATMKEKFKKEIRIDEKQIEDALDNNGDIKIDTSNFER